MFNNMLIGAAGESIKSTSGFQVANSILFNDDDTERLTKEYTTTRSSARLFTVSFWIKRGNLSLVQNIICQNDSNQNALTVQIQSDDTFNVLVEDSGGSAIMQRRTTAVYRDPHAWYHFHIKIDSGQTDDTSCRVYVNGVEETVFGTKTNPGSAQDTRILLGGGTNQLHIGTGKNGSDSPLDAYLAEVLILDGESVVPASATGEFDDNGVWRPVDPSSNTFGNNGFYLNFASSGSDIGDDASGNNQDFTPDNSPTQTTDTCTDNHATFSPLLSNASKVTLSEGNMRGASSTSSGHVGLIVSGFELPTAGKYYWEWVVNTVGTTPALGWRSVENLNPNGHSSAGNNQADFITGNDYNTGSGRILSSEIDGSTSLSQAAYGNFLTVSGGNPLANGSVLGCAYDADNGLAWFSFNNTWVDGNGTDSSSTVKNEIEAGTSGSQAFTTANGAVGEEGLHIIARSNSVSSFNYTLRTRSDQWTGTCPTGFTAVSTKNQAEAVTFAIEDGSAHFQATTYDGNDGSNEINQSGNSSFQPDWVWLKERDGGNHGTLINAVRGGNKGVYPSLNFVEYTESNLSFDDNGFSLSATGSAAQVNASSKDYIGWQWLAGNSSGSSNTDGSLTSTVTANQTAGFSILTFTGNAGDGGAQTVGHGLGKKPNMIIIKNLSTTDNWVVYHDNVGFNAITLNSTAARITTGASVYWNDTAFTSSVFTVNTHAGVNGDGNTMLCYCFADVPGYSKFGGYTGNDNANGPYIPLNFSPAFVMIKNITAAGGWPMYDNARTLFNPSNKNINADQNAAEYSPDYPIDFLANGFKIRDAQAYVNDANSYLYMAFAENPFAGPTPAMAR
jgi:hypothetical protein